jgi:hypothetical protein
MSAGAASAVTTVVKLAVAAIAHAAAPTFILAVIVVITRPAFSVEDPSVL